MTCVYDKENIHINQIKKKPQPVKKSVEIFVADENDGIQKKCSLERQPLKSLDQNKGEFSPFEP
jgi:hypothetical protein